MAYRLVSIEDAKTAREAETFVQVDTGFACIPTGRTVAVSNGWAVECYSVDGVALTQSEERR